MKKLSPPTVFLWCGSLILLSYLLIAPADAAKSVTDALSAAALKLVPSLFPFVAVCGIVVSTGLDRFIGRVLGAPFEKIFRINRSGAAAFFIGAVGGFPTGAIVTASLYDAGSLSSDEAERLLAISSNAGAAFCVGGIGMALFDSPEIGWLIYLAGIASAIIIGIVSRGAARKKRVGKTTSPEQKSNTAFADTCGTDPKASHSQKSEITRQPEKSSNQPSQKSAYSQENTTAAQTETPEAARMDHLAPRLAKENLPALVANSISNAGLSMLKIASFVVFFRVAADMLSPFLTRVAGKHLTAILTSFLEITTAAGLASRLDTGIGIIICGFAAGFSGLSVHGQVASAVGDRFGMKRFFFAKLAQGILTATLCAVCCAVIR